MDSFAVCHAEESQYFGEHFGEAIEAIKKANDTAFHLIRAAQSKSKGEADNILWMMAASCLMEFEDIFLLAGNGRGVGATKLLRGFYERTVTLGYLAKKPGKIKQFVDYSDVHWHKMLIEATDNHATFKLSDKTLGRIKNNFEKVESQFTKQKCKQCGTTELQGSWTKKPIYDMASENNETIRALAFNAYLRPTLHMHTTHFGIVEQCEQGSEGKLNFSDVNKQRTLAAQALSLAHILLVHLMDVINDKFKLEEIDRIHEAATDWDVVWKDHPSSTESEIAPESPPQSS
jgi:hypothetical protein